MMRWMRVALVAALFAQCCGAAADGPTASAPDGTFNGALARSKQQPDLIAFSSRPSQHAHYVALCCGQGY
jgi:hypothetical protein